MVEFFYIIHYIVYRFYRRHGEDFVMSLLYACGLHLILSFFMIGNIDYFICVLLDEPLHIDKSFAWGYIIFWAIFEYLVFFRNERYKEIFSEYIRLSDTPEMKAKFKKAKIFNYSLLTIDLLLLFLIDYCNHHK